MNTGPGTLVAAVSTSMMAISKYETTQFASEEFVESCGTVLINSSREPKKICLIRYKKKKEWLLPKGRRNCGESRHEAALRETREETGYSCRLHAVTMPTRCPPMSEEENVVADQVRVYPQITEPFFLTIRKTEGNKNVKIIFWYIATIDDEAPLSQPHGEVEFEPAFFSFDQGLEKISFQEDREILQKAIAILENI
jgi:8-oxo-dGTP pyrophosphatase MutT (NUDIX family)